MTDPQVAVMMLGIFLFTIMLGFPIAFTLIALAVAFGYYAYFDPPACGWPTTAPWMPPPTHGRWGDVGRRLLQQPGLRPAGQPDLFGDGQRRSDRGAAVPVHGLHRGARQHRRTAVPTLQIAARHIPGSMAVAALVTCTLFATATGIVGAVVTLMGLLAFPAMLKARYDESFASGVICAGGCLGILIPPSIMLIVYAATSGVSIVRLYAGALLPGLLLAGLYVIYVIGRAWLNPALAPKPRDEDIENVSISRLILLVMTSFFPLAFLILAVLGAILFGLATPTEAASMGALGGLFLAAAYRALTWDRLQEAVYLTLKTTAMVCWLFVGSWSFASVFSYLGGEHLISEFVTGLDLTPIMFLILAQIIIFLLGWPLEWSEIIIIFVPIFLPLLAFFEIDPLFFGILVALNLQTSFLTPPMAMSAYYLKGIAPPHIQLVQIFKGCMPYLVMILIAMATIYIFPQVVFYLPQVIYGR
jgi:tripartite ATP-independent transporter DctM subunit